MKYSFQKLPPKSNFDTRARFKIQGLRSSVIIEAAPSGDGYDNAAAKTDAYNIAMALELMESAKT